MKRATILLSIDSLAGLIAGGLVLAALPIVTVWHNWSYDFARFIGLANVAYGCYSGVLALYARRRMRIARLTAILLIVANSAWAVHCLAQVWLLRESASYLGLAHLLLEAIFVGGLAYIESRIVLPVAT